MSLKAKLAIVSALAAAIAILGTGTSRAAGAKTYEVAVDTIEGCSCPPSAPVISASADEHAPANNAQVPAQPLRRRGPSARSSGEPDPGDGTTARPGHAD
jgi:hypothetical protein